MQTQSINVDLGNDRPEWLKRTPRRTLARTRKEEPSTVFREGIGERRHGNIVDRNFASLHSGKTYPDYPYFPPDGKFVQTFDDIERSGARVLTLDDCGAVSSEQRFKELFRLLERESRANPIEKGDLHYVDKSVAHLLKTTGLFTPLLSEIRGNVAISTTQIGRFLDEKGRLNRIVLLRDREGTPLSIGVSQVLTNKLIGSDQLEGFKNLIINSEEPIGAALIATDLARDVTTEIVSRFRLQVGGTSADDFVSRVLDTAWNQEYRGKNRTDKSRLVIPQSLSFTSKGFEHVLGRMKTLSLPDIGVFAKVYEIPLTNLLEHSLPGHVRRSLVDRTDDRLRPCLHKVKAIPR